MLNRCFLTGACAFALLVILIPVLRADRYTVPDGDSADLIRFIEGLRNFEPRSQAEAMLHRQKAPGAAIAAAEKVLKREKDPKSEAAQKAKFYLIEARVAQIGDAEGNEQKQILSDLKTYLADRGARVTADEADLAAQAGVTLEEAESDLASDAYANLGKLLVKASDKEVVSLGKMLEGAGRRMNLVGNEMQITGTTLEGKKFDWSKYRGKVVLVDFWATWCGPCLEEMPNVQRMYDAYHDRGFEVVGISNDTDHDAVRKFVAKKEVPWPIIHEKLGEDDRQPMEEYYGVFSIPRAILVDRDGKVVSLNARGPELPRLLKKLIGPIEDRKEK